MNPKDYLMAEVAARFGKDKISWEDRILFTLVHIEELEEMTPEAKEPVLYQSAVRALRDVMAGKPTGYGCMFDCSASGIQILSILTGDQNASEISNVIGDTISDPYTHIYTKMVKKLGTESTLERDVVKKAIMTSLYGSEAEPERLFTGEELKVFYETMEEEVPKCWELNQFFLNFLKGSNALSYDWVMPDNFHVHCPVMETVYTEVSCLGESVTVGKKVNQPHNRNRSLSANVVHSIDAFLTRELIRRCNTSLQVREHVQRLLDTGCSTVLEVEPDNEMFEILWNNYKKTGFLSARILPYLNAYNIDRVEKKKVQDLLNKVTKKRFPIQSIHDCYSVHPNNAASLLMVFKELYAELAESNMLKSILEDVLGQEVELNIDKYPHLIRDSKYILF